MNSRVLSTLRGRLLPLILLAAVLAVIASCGSKPSTPEALYERVAELNGAGRTGEIWDLLTEDSKKDFMSAIDGHRDVLKRNPDPKQALTNQYNCTREEFHLLSYRELWIRENRGRERVFIDAKITGRTTDPRTPNETMLTITPPAGPKVLMWARQVSGGWELVRLRVDNR